MTFLFVLVANCLDLFQGILYIRDIVINGFIANELISIVENTGLHGLPLPVALIKAIDILNKKSQTSLQHSIAHLSRYIPSQSII